MIGSSKKNVSDSTPVSTTPSQPATSSSAATDQKVNALLGKGSEFEGKISFEGTVRIDGVMKGEIRSKEKLVIGDGAKVEAEIQVGSAIVSGNVKGNITASDRIELKSPAKVNGNVTTPVLIIEEGVTFDGNCSMSGKGGTAASTPSTPSSTSTTPKDN